MADGLAALVRTEGGRPWIFPAIEIQPPADVDRARDALSRAQACDIAIFISPSAARRGLELAGGWPASVATLALGSGTRAELARRGVEATSPLGGADSEALLSLPLLRDVTGKRILIICGEGGREVLGEALASRGAVVERAECYRRAAPRADAGPLLDAWERGEVHAVTAYSSESLANLLALLGERGAPLLRGTPLFVSHARVAEAARRRGAGEVHVAGPSDEELVARLVAYFERP